MFLFLVWSGRELGWAFYVFVLWFVFLCLAWYGSHSESSVVSDWEPYLGSLFSHSCLWVVVFCLVYVTLQNCFVSSISLCYFVLCVQSINYDGHLPRCILVRSFLLFLRRRGDSLQPQVHWKAEKNQYTTTDAWHTHKQVVFQGSGKWFTLVSAHNLTVTGFRVL